MSDVTAMIPVLLGSKRIPDKNIILVDGKVLCTYTINACKASGSFKEIYLNSGDEIFKSIAADEGVMFHKRPKEWGGRECQQKTKSRDCAGKRCVINDHYLYNFMTTGTQTKFVCQVNATSPLLEPETINKFVNTLVTGKYDSLFATHEVRAESFYQGKPITFTLNFKCPSNEIDPISSICWAIAGWKREAFIKAYEKDAPEENGPVFVGNLGLFPIDEREALDIDEWSTLEVIEQFLINRRTNRDQAWKYIDGRTVERK